MNHINICPTCIQRNDCVLTVQKSKVWSCSEYDEETSVNRVFNIHDAPQLTKESKLELVSF